MRACACDPHWIIRLLCNLNPDARNRSTPALLVKKCRITTIMIYYFVKAALWRGPAVFNSFFSRGKYWHGCLKMQIIAADMFSGKYRQRYLLRFIIWFKAHSAKNRTAQTRPSSLEEVGSLHPCCFRLRLSLLNMASSHKRSRHRNGGDKEEKQSSLIVNSRS